MESNEQERKQSLALQYAKGNIPDDELIDQDAILMAHSINPFEKNTVEWMQRKKDIERWQSDYVNFVNDFEELIIKELEEEEAKDEPHTKESTNKNSCDTKVENSTVSNKLKEKST